MPSRSLRDWQFDGHRANLVFDQQNASLRAICPHREGPVAGPAAEDVPACWRESDGRVGSEEDVPRCLVVEAFITFCDDELWDWEESAGFAPRLLPFAIAWRLDGQGLWVKPAHPHLFGTPCPTGCDADCDVACHEAHQVAYKRLHALGEHPEPAAVEAYGGLLAYSGQLEQRLAEAEASRARLVDELAYVQRERERATSYWNLATAKNRELREELNTRRSAAAGGEVDG